MHQHSHGLHHYHRRKRKFQKLEPFPHPVKWKRVIDHLIWVIIISGFIFTIPQILDIWVYRQAEGVSIVAWSWYALSSVFWIVYGFAHRDKAIIISSLLWVVFDLAIVVGTVIYG
ncbi:MAG TPA: hypothetical protein VJI98_01405 [Candidatus Nanoarchaeia archaeon]|nr:hypothetical protein [Candidatus Nanoarchaeia archaeon]